MSPPKWVIKVEPLIEVLSTPVSDQTSTRFTHLELPNILWLNDIVYCPFVLRASTRLLPEKRAMSFLVRLPFSPVPDASSSSIRSGAGFD